MKHASNEEPKADAKSRSLRTLLQGLAVAVLLAVAGVVVDVIGKWTHADFLDGQAWILFVTSVVQAALTAAASWIQRMFESRNE